jgi:integrin-linked kinase-associated serine/threonine phosphatase 2C
MPEIKLIPKNSTSVFRVSHDPEYHFACVQAKNKRKYQEDALTWSILNSSQFTPNEKKMALNPTELGYRLWTSYHKLDELFERNKEPSGCTASTTVYDGQGHFITATLGNVVSFAVIYSKKHPFLGVSRLNEVTHSLEQFRSLGSYDSPVRMEQGICSNASIDITSIDTLLAQHGIHRNDLDKVLLITASDGFTEGAGLEQQTKEDHELYLTSLLQEMNTQKNDYNEEILALHLLNRAKELGSTDNITLGIQRITEESKPMILGVYDGHLGFRVSAAVAEHLINVFKKQCALEPQNYKNQPLSVHKNKRMYQRDHEGTNLASISPLTMIQEAQDEEAHEPHQRPIYPNPHVFFQSITDLEYRALTDLTPFPDNQGFS